MLRRNRARNEHQLQQGDPHLILESKLVTRRTPGKRPLDSRVKGGLRDTRRTGNQTGRRGIKIPGSTPDVVPGSTRDPFLSERSANPELKTGSLQGSPLAGLPSSQSGDPGVRDDKGRASVVPVVPGLTRDPFLSERSANPELKTGSLQASGMTLSVSRKSILESKLVTRWTPGSQGCAVLSPEDADPPRGLATAPCIQTTTFKTANWFSPTKKI